jgi:hypothetical protein
MLKIGLWWLKWAISRKDGPSLPIRSAKVTGP